MESKIAFIELLSSRQKKDIFNNIPFDTEYIIIGIFRDFIDEGTFYNLPLGLKKIIIVDYDKTILGWSRYESLTQYLEFITGGKIPFGCKIETIKDEKEGYDENITFFDAVPDLRKNGMKYFKLNKLVKKGIYECLYYNWRGDKIEKDFLISRGKNIYFNIEVE